MSRDHSFHLDEFGIIQPNDRSRSSDSIPVEDPSLNLTDDDTSARLLEGTETSENEDLATFASNDRIVEANTSECEVHDISSTAAPLHPDLRLQIDELTANITGASEDISKSDAYPASAHQSRSGSPDQEETESLTEFEEIERLIKANTAQDTDGELSDIPIELEQRILSGRVSRESTRSSHASLKRDTSCESERSKAQDHCIADDTALNKASGSGDPQSTAHHDTGYASEVQQTMLENEEGNRSRSSINHDHSNEPIASPSPGSYDHFPPLDESHPAASDQHDAMSHHEDHDDVIDHFVIPTNRNDIGDTNQPESLVATFGTTEDFEVLLQKHLDDIEVEEGGGMHSGGFKSDQELDYHSQHDYGRRSSENLASTQRKRLQKKPTQSSGIDRGKSPSPSRQGASIQAGKTKLKLSRTSKTTSDPTRDSPRSSKWKQSRSNAQRSTRSPAASRVRRANNTNGRSGRLASMHRESSDDLSVRSDISKNELRSKLKEEARERKKDEEFVKELQNNYDTLLLKFAEAENTIDHLRLGAKINLFASVPRPSAEAPTLPFEEAHLTAAPQPHQVQTSDMPGDSPDFQRTRAPSAGSDTLVESSLQLPAAATKEFLKVALQLQAKDVQDKIDSLTTLLRENALNHPEQERAMRNIERSLRDLERDYLSAVDEHADEQRRICIATGGAIDQALQFDPEQTMEADIMRLGERMKNLRNHISAQTDPHINTPVIHHSPAPHSAKSKVEGERSADEVRSSLEEDVDERFNRLLKQYNRSLPQDDDDTTAPSLVLSSMDEDDKGPPERVIPNRYFQPPSARSDAVTASVHMSHAQTDPKPVPARRRRSPSSESGANGSMTSASPSPTRSRSSKLPRPVRSSKEGRRDSPEGRRLKKTADKGTDSGFVGSESSRQSAKPLEPTKVKLISRPSMAVEVKRTPDLTLPPAERRRSPSKASTTTTVQTTERAHPLHTPPPSLPPGYLDRVAIYRPNTSSYSVDDSVDDVSTTSTVREMLQSHPPSYGTKPHQTPSFAPKSGTSMRTNESSRRSVASSTKDSTLDLIRGEISKLRDEIKAAKSQDGGRPMYTSTPRLPPAERVVPNVNLDSDSETLRAIRDDIKALKDEVKKQGRGKNNLDILDGASVRSAVAPSTGHHTRSDREDTDRGRRSRRSRSLGRDDLSEASEAKSVHTRDRQRRRSKSHDRTGPWSAGFWTYVPPPAPVWGAASVPVGRAYTRDAPPTRTIVAPAAPTIYSAPPVAPTIYSAPPVVHAAPVIGSPANAVYVEEQTPATVGRLYLPSNPSRTRIYPTPSKPKASIFISPKRSSSLHQSLRKADVYVMESDDEPLRRSHLRGLRRSSSLTGLHREHAYVTISDPRLNDSINRAERFSDELRAHSRSMYRSMRDDAYRAQLLADTM